MPNTAQTEEWNGATGAYWASHDERYDAMLRPLTERLFAATPIAATDQVLGDLPALCRRKLVMEIGRKLFRNVTA